MTAWIPASDVQAWIGADKIDMDGAATLAQIASDAVQAVLQRNLTLRTAISETTDSNGTDYVLLGTWPIRSVASVRYNGQSILPAAFQRPGWLVDTFNTRKLRFAGMGKLPRDTMNIAVVYTAGYDVTQPLGGTFALPGNVYQALALTAAATFNAQAADPNLASESTAGVFSGQFYATGVGAVPPGALSLLRPQMRVAP